MKIRIPAIAGAVLIAGFMAGSPAQASGDIGLDVAIINKGIVTVGGVNYLEVRATFKNTSNVSKEVARYYRGQLRSGKTGFYVFTTPGTTTRDTMRIRCGTLAGYVSYEFGNKSWSLGVNPMTCSQSQ